MIPDAEIRHALAQRTRIGIAERRGQVEYFATLAETLEGFEGVLRVTSNAVTGSVLIEHGRPLAHIAGFAEAQGLFRLSPPRPDAHTPAAQAAAGLATLDSTLKRFTEGDLNARSAILLTLIALALVQAARGQVLGPASTLLWAALSLVRSEGK
jgi:hypothetical protein